MKTILLDIAFEMDIEKLGKGIKIKIQLHLMTEWNVELIDPNVEL